ncbi:MAG TPA: c-type cytochrome [Puia sp.]|nr:c-type cytochrome [Puia sp.]
MYCYLLSAKARRLLPLLILMTSLVPTPASAQTETGKALFQSNCAQCHNPIKVVTGPALKGVTSRVPDRKLLHEWIHNNNKVLASGNVYFNNLYNSYGRTPMNIFPNLSDADIDAILQYVETYAEPVAKTNNSNYAPSPEQEDHTLLYGIITFILLFFVGGLYLVNNNLKKLADEKRGLPPAPHIPWYRNKRWIAFLVILVFLLLGWWVVQAGIGLGRQQGYEPQQPIFFSHRVHAGNLPDLVYFNHSQHVHVGHVQCQTCHGPIQEMDEVRQFADLSMGWCISCHRTTKVDFPEGPNGVHGNKFYSIYKPFFRYLKQGRIDSVTVENIGGTECQKCHY